MQFNAETLVPLGSAVAVMVFVGTLIWKISNVVAGLRAEMHGLAEELKRTRESIAQSWTIADMRFWTMDLRASNPSVTVPEPRRVN